MIEIKTREQFEQFKSSFQGLITSSQFLPDGIIINNTHKLPLNCSNWINSNSSEYANNLIFGKDKTKNVVSVEVKNGEVYIYTETPEGISLETKPFKYWIMSNLRPNGIFTQMDGDLHYRYLKEFNTEKEWKEALSKLWRAQADKYVCYDQREAFMVREGLTYFKGMKVENVSILSFDIETTGINPDSPDAKVLLISNTLRKNGIITRKLFALDEFKNELSMLQEWCNWVRDVNPSIIVGHNIFGFDLKYLQARVKICGATQIDIDKDRSGLRLGRDDSIMEISDKVSQFRYDGSQQYDYNKINIFGREIVDTFFLSMKYDVGRNFSSYGLKSLIKELGYEREDRIKWDFEKNKPKDFFGKDKELTRQFKEYCICDSYDSLKLFDLMIPSYFYTNVNIPKTFQQLLLSATGAWVNSFLIRGYLGVNHSIPKPSEATTVYGGISFGVPGVYRNLFKVDVASEYPSIIRQFRIEPKGKDPLGYYLKMVDYFTEAKFSDKRKFKETGDKYYDDLQASKKIFINSSYGVLACRGVHFNDFEAGDKITGIGRQVLRSCLKWASGKDVNEFMLDYDLNKDKQYEGFIVPELKYKHDFIMAINDTDSISFCKKDMSEFSEEEMKSLLKEINDFLPEKIRMEDDGIYKRVVVLKSKNYILDNGKKIKFKGSAMTSGSKELALLEFCERFGTSLLDGLNYAQLNIIYEEYIKEVFNIKDIKRWAVKKTVTKPVLLAETDTEARTNEKKVFSAIKHLSPQEGDKVYVYYTNYGEIQKTKKGVPQFKKDGSPKMVVNEILKTIDMYNNDTVPEKLIKRIYDTLSIFETVIDLSQFIDYTKKVSIKLLDKFKGRNNE